MDGGESAGRSVPWGMRGERRVALRWPARWQAAPGPGEPPRGQSAAFESPPPPQQSLSN